MLAGPTPPAPFTADEGGGGAELEEGGRDLEREWVRVCVVLGGCGQDGTMMVVGSWWMREEVEETMEREGRSASYCLSPAG